MKRWLCALGLLAMPAWAATRCVAPDGRHIPPFTTWVGAATTIQAAIDIAAPGDLILVSNGVYAAGGRAAAGLLSNRAAITSRLTVASVNGPDVTIILGQGPVGPAAMRCAFVGSNAVLAGFTLADGATRDDAGPLEDQNGGGAYCQPGGIISNCVIRHNTAFQYGGGVFAGRLFDTTLLDNNAAYGGGALYASGSCCVLAGNGATEAGGGVYGGYFADSALNGNWAGTGGAAAEAELDRCALVGNFAPFGGGAYGGTLVGCDVRENYAWFGGGLLFGQAIDCVLAGNLAQTNGGGAAYSTNLLRCALLDNDAGEFGGGAYNCLVARCLFSNNNARAGGGAAFGSGAKCVIRDNRANESAGGVAGGAFTNCMIFGNRAVFGGGASQSRLECCTVVDNLALDFAGGLMRGQTRNSIVYYNRALCGAENIYLADSADRCDFTCTAPDPGGIGNITNDPVILSFREPRLLPGSPCIDRGTNAPWMAADTDLDGEPRLDGGVSVDLGADEVHPGNLTGAVTAAASARFTVAAAGFPIRFAADLHGKTRAFRWNFGDGVIISNRCAVEHAFASAGLYAVQLETWNNDQTAGAAFPVRIEHGFTNYVAPAGAHLAPFTSWAAAATSIQAAVAAAPYAGSLVLVTDGVYAAGAQFVPGSETPNRVVITNGVIVRSVNGAAATVIDAAGAGRGAYVGDASRLEGFTLTNGQVATRGGGVYGEYDAMIARCVIAGNRARLAGGGAAYGRLRNCLLAGNRTDGSGGGSFGSRIENCTLAGNAASGRGGGAHKGAVLNSILYFNRAALGDDNILPDGGSCDYSCVTPAPAGGQGNITAPPGLLAIDNPRLMAGSPCLGRGQRADWMSGAADLLGGPRLRAGQVDLGCVEYDAAAQTGALTVAISCDYPAVVAGFPVTFRAGVAGAAANYIWQFGDGAAATGICETAHAYVRTGCYTVTLQAWNPDTRVATQITVQVVPPYTNYVAKTGGHVWPFTSWADAATNIQDAIAARPAGGGSVLVQDGEYTAGPDQAAVASITNGIRVTSLNGPAATVLRSSGTARCAYVGRGAELAGFTLTGGWSDQGGGAYAEQDGMLSNCWIAGNAAAMGGGLYGGVARNCVIANNTAITNGGGAYAADLADCAVEYNTAGENGGGAWGCVIRRGRLYKNTADGLGGGAYFTFVYDGRIESNAAGDGGGAAGCRLWNCLVYANRAGNGGGLFGNLSAWNCTVVRNYAESDGGGVYASPMDNSIIYENKAEGGGPNFDAAGRSEFHYSCTTPAPAGWGNLTNAPLFENSSGGDYRLQALSPCIDRGINQEWMGGALDLGGNPRILNGAVDMGAHEFGFTVAIRLFLQGPYDRNLHRMTAGLGAYLPRTAPYTLDARTVSNIPPNTTDWVLFQVRPATSAAPVYARSVFLRSDGWLTDEAGRTALVFAVTPGAAYQVAVQHRNHLTALAARSALFNTRALSYDFTASSSRYAGGTNGAVRLETGITGLPAGDADSDNEYLAADAQVFDSQLGRQGYLRGDFNLDGRVTADEYTEYWYSNRKRRTAVSNAAVVLNPLLPLSPERKTVPAGAEQVLQAQAATGAVNWTFARNVSGGTLRPLDATTAVYRAGATADCTDVVMAWNVGNALGRAWLNVIGTGAVAQAGRALIIAGRKSADDPLWPTTDYLARECYANLRYRGFGQDNIHYLSPLPGPDVDAAATFDNAAAAFTNWAKGAARLLVYLVDHGGQSSGQGFFRLNDSEIIPALQLDAWLDGLQDQYGTEITLVIDCCYAGSFMSYLAYGGAAHRIVITACGINEPTYFVAGGLASFSAAFLNGVLLGLSVGGAFDLAQAAMQTYQGAMIDDDGNGRYIPGVDGAYAATVQLGPGFVAGQDIPQIGEVSGNQYLEGDSRALLWASGVAAASPLDRVWCLVIPPGHAPDPANPVSALPELELVFNPTTGRYENDYRGFTVDGIYTVTFYARDMYGAVSPPRQSYVVQGGFDERAVLVAAGPTNDPAWPAIENMTRLAYATFAARRIPTERICVLCSATNLDFDGDGATDVAAAPSRAALSAAITNWAAGCDRLDIGLVGIGTNNMLALNPWENLAGADLRQDLDATQAARAKACTIVLEFAGAGAFLPAIASQSEFERINIAATAAGQPCLWDQNGLVSFFRYFMSYVGGGRSLKEAFLRARRLMRVASGARRQTAQLDDNRNGIPNEKNMDGVLSATRHIGSAFATGDDAPAIGAVTPDLLLDGSATVTLWAAGVASVNGITNVWCTITPPDYAGTNPLPRVDLVWSETAQRYEGTYGFSVPGIYVCTFQARDCSNRVSAPVQAWVMGPDGYEPDDEPRRAYAFAVNETQTHNFHRSNDCDWVKFLALANQVYEIETIQLGTNADTALDIYYERADGTLTNIDADIDDSGAGLDDGEYTRLDRPEAGMYYVRVRPATGANWGAGSAYDLKISVPIAGGDLMILARVDLLGVMPAGATAWLDGGAATPMGGVNHIKFANVAKGAHTVQITGLPAGYFPEEAPNLPGQENNVNNSSYGNPRLVQYTAGISDGIGGYVTFAFMPMGRVTARVRDGATGLPVSNAYIRFINSDGRLTGQTYDGWHNNTVYKEPWFSGAGGLFPTNVWLPAAGWKLVLSRAGYRDRAVPNAVTNLPPGALLDLGVIELTPGTNAPAAITNAPFGDYNGDGKSELAVYDPAASAWYIRTAAGPLWSISGVWGWRGCTPVSGDFDGDCRTDFTVYYEPWGNWYVLRSSDAQMFTTNWGLFGGESCRPVAGDYDGDGRTDLAVYRRTNAFWFILQSSDCQPVVVQWGWAGTLPAPGDYDGDNRTDLAVYDPAGGNWWITPSASHRPYVINWGFAGCAPVPGDYDGDGKTDLAVYHAASGGWYILKSSNGQMRQAVWGFAGCAPVPGDYDGDGWTDLCVYYAPLGMWYIVQSSNGQINQQQWGWSSAAPLTP